MKPWLIGVVLLAAPVAAQQSKPVIPQPTTPSGVRPGDSGPAKWQNRSRRDPESRAAVSDTAEILQVLARKLSLSRSEVRESQIVIQRDTAWVTLMHPSLNGSVYRFERHNTWKMAEPR